MRKALDEAQGQKISELHMLQEALEKQYVTAMDQTKAKHQHLLDRMVKHLHSTHKAELEALNTKNAHLQQNLQQPALVSDCGVSDTSNTTKVKGPLQRTPNKSDEAEVPVCCNADTVSKVGTSE